MSLPRVRSDLTMEGRYLQIGWYYIRYLSMTDRFFLLQIIFVLCCRYKIA